LIYNRYEYFFHYPSPEELFDNTVEDMKIGYLGNKIVYYDKEPIKASIPILKEIEVNGQILLQETGSTQEQMLYGDYKTEEQIYQNCVQWSTEELQSKFRHYTMIIYAIADTVEATFRRALGGKERESLRKNISINQSLSAPHDEPQFQNRGNWHRPSTW